MIRTKTWFNFQAQKVSIYTRKLYSNSLLQYLECGGKSIESKATPFNCYKLAAVFPSVMLVTMVILAVYINNGETRRCLDNLTHRWLLSNPARLHNNQSTAGLGNRKTAFGFYISHCQPRVPNHILPKLYQLNEKKKYNLETNLT
jgi:hypothetical protein